MFLRCSACAALAGLAVVFALVGCERPASRLEAAPAKKTSTTIVHSGGASEWIETEAGYELKIYISEQDGMASGLSPGLAKSIFARGIVLCGTIETVSPDVPTFRCVDRGCTRECRIWSADVNAEDDSTNRVEQPNDEGFVYCMTGRCYWCKCE